MSFRLVPKSVTFNDLERRNGVILRYFSECGYLPCALRKSLRSLSHLLMSSCTVMSTYVDRFLHYLAQSMGIICNAKVTDLPTSSVHTAVVTGGHQQGGDTVQAAGESTARVEGRRPQRRCRQAEPDHLLDVRVLLSLVDRRQHRRHSLGRLRLFRPPSVRRHARRQGFPYCY